MPDDGEPVQGHVIRDSSASPEPVEHDRDDTFFDMLSIHLDQPVGSMSISPANRDVALGARKGLYIVDLQNPYDPPRFLPHSSAWEVADVQWNPFPARSEWVASTSNQKAIIFNLSQNRSLSLSPVEYTLHAHTRAVTDINWAAHSPETMATCGLDGWVWTWDLRVGFGKGASKPVWGVCSWNQGATQVKWNRRGPHTIASAHGRQVHIWDNRMGAVPVHTIEGHVSKIYGIDWSRRVSSEIITCSLDASFKYWSLASGQPKLSVQTSAPVWRARNLPFGRGVLTLPQRSDYALSIWSFDKLEQDVNAAPVARFEGARQGVQEFVWRTRGGNDLDSDDRQFQLVTWAKDRRLRLWPISDEILKEVGHVKGGPITIPVTRRNCPDISYRTLSPAEKPAPISFTSPKSGAQNKPQLATSPPGRSLLTSSLLTAGLAKQGSGIAAAGAVARWRAPTMSTNPIRNRRQRAAERLAWMEGVKVFRPNTTSTTAIAGAPVETRQHRSNSNGMPRAPETRSSSIARGTDAGTLRDDAMTMTERPDSAAGSRTVASAATREDRFQNLGEELLAAVRRNGRATFERVEVAERRCTVSFYRPEFMRVTFTFPKSYPSSPASLEIERSRDLTIKQRNTLTKQIKHFLAEQAQQGQPAFEPALRMLMATPKAVIAGPDEDDDDDKADASQLEHSYHDEPIPASCGAIFSPTGRLFMFRSQTLRSSGNSDLAWSEIRTTGDDDDRSMLSRLPVSEGFGHLPMRDTNAVENDEALLPPVTTTGRSNGNMFQRLGMQDEPRDQQKHDSIIRIRDVSHLTIVKPSRAMVSLTLPPADSVQDAISRSSDARDPFLTVVWRTVDALLTGKNAVPDSKTSELTIQSLMALLGKMGDIQTLGFIACLLDNLIDSPLSPAFTAGGPGGPASADTLPSPVAHSVDYFSHRRISTSTAGGVRTPYMERTPRADLVMTASSTQTQSPGAKASWANLGNFFNTSMLSLRSGGTPPTPGSGDRVPILRTPSTGRPSPTSGTARSTGTGSARLTGRARPRVSPNVTFGQTDIAVIETPEQPPAQGAAGTASAESERKRRVKVNFPELDEFVTKAMPWWRTTRARIDLELVKLALVKLLDRWQDDLTKTEVIKFCHATDDFAGNIVRSSQGLGPDRSIVICRTCSNCDEPLMNGSTCVLCQQNVSKLFICSVCRLPMKGLFRPCTRCLHAGHVSCINDWFGQTGQRDCPAGCGCQCEVNGGAAGQFVVTRPPLTTLPSLRRIHDSGGRMPFFQ